MSCIKYIYNETCRKITFSVKKHGKIKNCIKKAVILKFSSAKLVVENLQGQTGVLT